MSGDELLSAIVEKVNEEIATYRKRQLTALREAIIIQAVITWGLFKIIPSIESPPKFLKSLAAIACLATAIIGVAIIRSYMKRICYLRENREKAVKKLCTDCGISIFKNIRIFYPVDEFTLLENNEYSKYRTRKTSMIYSITLLIFGSIAAVTNLVGVIF